MLHQVTLTPTQLAAKDVRSRLLNPIKIKIEAKCTPQPVPITYPQPNIAYVHRTSARVVQEERLRNLKKFMEEEEQKLQRDKTLLIADFVARRYNVELADIFSDRRQKTLVWARHLAMYLSLALTGASTPAAARYFGGRDHTTLVYARQRVDRLMAANEGVNAEVTVLRRDVEEYLA
jgi:chromosomal replication initiation ATPase DnaA